MEGTKSANRRERRLAPRMKFDKQSGGSARVLLKRMDSDDREGSICSHQPTLTGFSYHENLLQNGDKVS